MRKKKNCVWGEVGGLLPVAGLEFSEDREKKISRTGFGWNSLDAFIKKKKKVSKGGNDVFLDDDRIHPRQGKNK